MNLREQLPAIYQNILNAKILTENPSEPLATCDNCLMSRPERGNLPYYSPDLKCCTYHPFMPNYLIGSILSDPQIPEFIIHKIRAKISQNEFALPVGIVAPPSLQIEYQNRKTGEFGCRTDWICPYFDSINKNCGIWKHRGSVCTTFYCKSIKKKKGESYWFSISEYLSFTEMFLAEECLAHFGYSPKEVSAQMLFVSHDDADDVAHGGANRSTDFGWKIQTSAIEKFYIECFNFVKTKSRKRFLNEIGEIGKDLEKSCLKYYKDAKYE